MSKLPKQYQWLDGEPGPRILKEALKHYGVQEAAGDADNRVILQWAAEVGLERVYKADSTAWCGLFVSYVAGEAGWEHAPRGNALWARNWLAWGNPVEVPMLGDVLIFDRGKGQGHVGLYVAEDSECYHVLGGNQSNAVNIKRIVKDRLLGSRRCRWRISQPRNVRRVRLASTGAISTNEA
jgi:uncharacterized protein (TIGR02594 family)